MQRGAERSGWLRIRQAWIDSADRINPSRGAVMAMASVALAVAVLAGLWVLAARPARLSPASYQQPSPAASPKAGGSLASPLATSAPAVGTAQVVVDVVGKVRRPGVYRLSAGARVTDALAAAGGATAGTDLTSTNLARKLSDGEQIAVGIALTPVLSGGQPGAQSVGGLSGDGQPGGPEGTGGSAAPLDLNAATESQLDGLPGVGPVLAQHIIEWRTAHGRFDSVAQLNSVSGIGDAKFADLRGLVAVG